MEEFDENKAVACMRKVLNAEDSAKYSDDELLNLIDIIWDFYEQNGLLDINFAIDDDSDDPESLLSDLVDYAARMLRKDRNATLAPELLEPLIIAEMEYEDSLLSES